MRLAITRRTIIAAIVAALLLIGALIIFLRLPQAVITVTPASIERSVTREITLSSGTTEPDFVRFILPAKFAEAEVTVNKTINRAGGKTFDDFAKGTVTLVNKQDEEQRLLPKTHLRDQDTGVFFLSDAAVVIPPLGNVKVTVTAKEKGPTGNVAAGKLVIDKLPASLQDQVYAESATPFTGGISTDTPLTNDEINQAKAAALTEARDKVRAELATKAGGIAINDQLLAVEVTEENVSAAAGSQATSFAVATRVTGRGFFPDTNDVLSLTLLALRSSPKGDEEFISYVPESFKLEIVRSDFARGEARVKGTLSGKFAQKTGPSVFTADNLAGRGEPEVQEYFKQFPSVSNVDVVFSPFWVSTVPARRDATKIVIKNIE